MIENLKKLSIYIIFIILLFFAYKVLKIFLVPFFWALILSIILNPLSKFFTNKFKNENFGILLTILIFILIILIPLSYFLIKLGVEIYNYTPEVMKKISRSGTEMEKYYEEFKKNLSSFGINLSEVTNFFAQKISSILQKLFQNVLRFFFQIIFIILFLYLILKYNKFFQNLIFLILPFEKEKNEKLLKDSKNFMEAIIYGIFLTAVIQALFSIIGFYIFKIPIPLFFGTLIFIFAFIPLGGASIVWIPLSIYLILTGNIKSGILLGLWCLIFVSTLDNLARPYLVSKKFKVNTFYVLISILGGVSALGGIGVFYGPLILFVLYEILSLSGGLPFSKK